MTTLTEEVAKQGGDFEENIKILARERDLLEQYGINLTMESYPVTEEVAEEEKTKLDDLPSLYGIRD